MLSSAASFQTIWKKMQKKKFWDKSHYVVHTTLELEVMLMSQLPESWGYRCNPITMPGQNICITHINAHWKRKKQTRQNVNSWREYGYLLYLFFNFSLKLLKIKVVGGKRRKKIMGSWFHDPGSAAQQHQPVYQLRLCLSFLPRNRGAS